MIVAMMSVIFPGLVGLRGATLSEFLIIILKSGQPEDGGAGVGCGMVGKCREREGQD
jgi:hypothetical protein